MTGILPVPKQETESGLNNFDEYTMLDPDMFAEYIGFTEAEVDALCQKYHMHPQELKDWYEGYQFGSVGSVYCPASVIKALTRHRAGNYWTRTSSATILFNLMNAADPRFQDIVRDLLGGEPVKIKVDKKGIDLSDLGNLNTSLTALVHLGYLNYQNGTVRIPNLEVAEEFFAVSCQAENNPAYRIIARSQDILNKTLAGETEEVARILEDNHNMYSSAASYNRESDLASLILISYKGCFEDEYTFFRELPTGKGFADIVFLPRISGKIPIIIELKWDKSADTAIRQIKDRRYTGRVRGYPSALLVGISYEKDHEKPGYKEHTCVIEQIDNP